MIRKKACPALGERGGNRFSFGTNAKRLRGDHAPKLRLRRPHSVGSAKNKSLGEHVSTRKGGLRLSGSLNYNHSVSLIRSARNRPGELPAPANDKAAASITNAADTFAR